MLFEIPLIEEQLLHNSVLDEKHIDLSVIRLDRIHPVISGNKLFKLHHFLQQAIENEPKSILTFGGAYSNHLAATAYACNRLGLKSIGIVRGEESSQLSHTLLFCRENKMQLKFISRNEYAEKDNESFIQKLCNEFDNPLIVPEGGYDARGAKGASLIMDLLKDKNYTHVCCATGTATTIAGLLSAVEENQQIISIPVLKGMNDIEERILFLINDKKKLKQLTVLNNYHFGGYAKSNTELFSFMNELYKTYQLPTDFVYTGKMMFGVFDAIEKNLFQKGSKIACLHTGGLQGNLSLPKGTLIF